MELHPIGKLTRGGVLDVGLKCPHSCKFCYYRYLNEGEKEFVGMRKAPFRTVEECKAILGLLKGQGLLNFDYTGGEPTLHPGIVEITRYAHRELGLKGRIITLGQFLMAGRKSSGGELLIDQLLDAGLTNFLFSVHAAEDGLFRELTGGSFEKLEAAMNHLDQRGFQYTSNTTVCALNYQHLPRIAERLLRHQIYLHNFIVMNAYYEWGRDGCATGVQARYSEIEPYLREAVQILESGKVAVNIRYAPLCTLRGLEKNVVGFTGVRYDPYEWRNMGGHGGGTPAECAQPVPIEEGRVEQHIFYREAACKLPSGVELSGMRGNGIKVFPRACGGCFARAVCDGVDPNYLAAHGAAEFIPYVGSLERGPLHSARRTYEMPFMVKTGQFEDMRSAVAAAFGRRRAAPSPGVSMRPDRVPLISVIIPCFNYARYLPEAVVSVLRQSLQDFEIIIVNDGSTDDTRAVAEALIAANPDYDIRLINQQNSGQPAASRNNGIKAARGRFILCLDADDALVPTMLARCARLLIQDPGVAIAYTDRLDFDGVCQIVRPREYDFSILRYANHMSYCALFRREVWEQVGGYRTNVKGCEDWDFWIAAGARGHRGRRIPEPLFKYRRHDQGIYQDVLQNGERIMAQIVLNNREVYEPQAVAAAERLLAGRELVLGQAGA